MVDYVLKPAERDRLQVTVDAIREAPRRPRSAGDAPDASGMQQLLHKLTAKINPGRARLPEVDPGDASARASR